MNFRRTTIQALAPLIISGGLLALSGNALANDSEELEKLRALVQELDQKVKVIERKDEIAAEDAAAKKKETPVVNAGPSGFSLKSADGQFEYRLKGLVQFDHRNFIDDDNNSSTNNSDGFTARRIRPTFEGTLAGKYDFRFTPEFGEARNFDTNTIANNGNISRVIDAYVDARIQPWFKVRVGKHKPFVGLERLQSGGDIKFIERSYVSNNILPNRALGVSIYGDVLDNKLNYAVGGFNGSNDGGEDSTAVDTDNGKEYTARLFATPFKGEDSVLDGLGFGLAVTHSSNVATNAVSPGTLPNYKTPAQQLNFFQYTNTNANGSRDRIAPQAYYYYGPFGLIAEYARVSQDVINGTLTDKLKNDAWQIAGSWVLTGEDASFKSVKPKNPFQTGKDGWGAWEVVARYQENSIDSAAFTTATQTRFADPRTQAREAKTWGVGLNWYLNQWVRLAVNYEQTKFDGGGNYNSAGTAIGNFINIADRNDEKILFSRLQFQF